MIKKRELRKKEIESKIAEVTDSIMIVDENLPKETEDFINSGLVKEGIYKKIEFAIENILDICNIINSDLRLGTPETEDSILENLKNNRIFDKKVIDIISEMKKFRNILVHKYGKINDKKAFEDIKEGLKDFEIIVKEIENFLEKHKTLEKEKTK